MGKDIHFAFQGKSKNKKDWQNLDLKDKDYKKYYDKWVFDGRLYELWEVLDSIGTPGCPKELQKTKLYYNKEYDYYNWNIESLSEMGVFGFTYCTFDEIKKQALKIKDSFKKGEWVSEDFLNKFYSFGGKLPKGMEIDDLNIVTEDDKYLIECLDEFINSVDKIAKKFDLDDSDVRICWHYDW